MKFDVGFSSPFSQRKNAEQGWDWPSLAVSLKAMGGILDNKKRIPHDVSNYPSSPRFVLQSPMTQKPSARILVVDDEPSVGMIFHRILGDAGYEVVSASNGAECLRVLNKGEVQLVFLDLQMPGMDGVQTLKKIRESPISTLPVIIMTAFQTVNSAVETMKLGALDYLIKPLAADKLPSVVQQALNVTKMSSQVHPVKVTPVDPWG
jgi:CheY-like chemotaxis protein